MSGTDSDSGRGGLVKVAGVDQVPPGAVVGVTVDGVPLAVVHEAGGGFHVLHDQCTHASVRLSEGEVEGATLECWLHGARFDLRTGQPGGPPATRPVQVYPVEVHDGQIFVRLDAPPAAGQRL